jgi:hypothetical protein
MRELDWRKPLAILLWIAVGCVVLALLLVVWLL